MYSMLLVDDESLVLERMEKHIDWSQMDIVVVDTAKNGKEGLRKALLHRPDFILTDIKMPIMNGLDFAKQAQEQLSSTQIIFLTGYNDFQFVKSALQLRAANYLLKPIQIEELTETIEEMKKQLHEKKKNAQLTEAYLSKLWRSAIADPNPDNRNSSIHQLARSFKHASGLENAYYLTGLFSASPLSEAWTIRLRELAPSSHFVVLSDRVSFVLTPQSTQLQVESWVNQLQDVMKQSASSFTIWVHPEPIPLHNIYEFLQTRQNVLERISYYFPSEVTTSLQLSPEAVDEDAASEQLNQLKQEMLSFNTERANQLIEAIINRFSAEQWDITAVQSAIYHSLCQLYEELAMPDSVISELGASKEQLLQSLIDITTIHELRDWLIQKTHATMEWLKSNRSDEKARVVAVIQRIVRNNLHEPINIDSIAQQVYLSPNYVRTIFRDVTGKTLHEYVMEERMNYALLLLKDKSLKIHEVSARIGYENTSYFCSVFSKYKGMTPNEYRKKCL